MSKRHSTPHSLQFAKLLCWGTFGTLCFRLCTKDFDGFSLLPFLQRKNNMANPLMKDSDMFTLFHSNFNLWHWKRSPNACPRICNPVSLKSNALDAGLLAACFGLGGIVASWIYQSRIWKSLAVFWIHDPWVSARTQPRLRFKFSNMFVHSARIYT